MDLKILETILLVSINATGVFIIIVVLSSTFNQSTYRWFAAMTVGLLAWVNLATIAYFVESTELATFTYRLNFAAVVFFFLAAYKFYIEYFLGVKNRLSQTILVIISIALSGLILFTNTVISSTTKQQWGNEISLGSLSLLIYLFFTVMTGVFIYYSISRYIRASKAEKRKILFFLIGTFFLISFNVLFNIASPIIFGTARYQHLGDYSAVVFLVFTVFAILRREFLNVKITFAAFLISIIGIFLIVDIFVLSDNLVELLIKLAMFLLFLGVSILLLRSIMHEMYQREELVKANQDLKESRLRYLRLAEEQKGIIDVMGHEIRTPLTTIVQEINLQKQVNLTKEKQQSWLKGIIDPKDASLIVDSFETMDTAVTQAVSLANEMLESARLDHDSFKLDYSKFDLVTAVKSSIDILKKTYADRINSIDFKTSFTSLQVKADATRIRQAVDALLTNITKYGVDQETGKADIEVKLSAASENVRISVKDHGIGIAAEDIGKLGAKFARLNPDTNSKLKRPGGSGLGLYVAKGIANKHGGKLLIESEGIGKGATFSLDLPVISQ